MSTGGGGGGGGESVNHPSKGFSWRRALEHRGAPAPPRGRVLCSLQRLPPPPQAALSSSSSSSARPPQRLEHLDDASLRRCRWRPSQPNGPFFFYPFYLRIFRLLVRASPSFGTDTRPPLVLVLRASSTFACVRICRSNLRAVAPLPWPSPWLLLS